MPSVSVAEFQYPGGPWIREIRLESSPIFSERERKAVPWIPLGLVDRVHYDTREDFILRELLFRPGDPFDPERIGESARHLRDRGIFAEVELEAIPVGPDSVDVEVRTREIWTTTFDLGWSVVEGKTLFSTRINERNFLGRGRSLSAERSVELDRNSWSWGYGDPQLFGRRWSLSVGRRESSDGQGSFFSLGRPFERVDAPRGFRFSFVDGESRPRASVGQNLYVRPRVDLTHLQLWFNWRLAMRESGAWRLGPAIWSSKQEVAGDQLLVATRPGTDEGQTVAFDEAPGEDRSLWAPSLRLVHAPRHFISTRFLYSMGRVEDLPTDPKIQLWLGWLLDERDGSQGAWWRLDYDRFGENLGWLWRSAASTRGVVGRAAPGRRIQAGLTGWKRFGSGFQFVVHGAGALGEDLDRHRHYTLGVENGLRGARVGALRGDRLMRANVALRWNTASPILQLATPGFALFFDAGDAWLAEERGTSFGRWGSAIGFGLRIGLDKASQAIPIRLDFAWPLDSSDGVQINAGAGLPF